MFFGLAAMLLFGYFAGEIFKKLRLPALMGMLFAGVIIGPHVLGLIDEKILSISAELRKIALVVILMRAGLSLDLSELKKNGRPAVLMCFLPACFEIAAMIFFAPRLMGVTHTEAAIMGATVGAVSPAVIVPKMLKLAEEGYGKKHGIPQLVMAGASVDDVFVIVMFYAFVALEQTGEVSPAGFVKIPASIALGIAAGLALGVGAAQLFRRVHIRDTVKIIILMGISFALAGFEDTFGGTVPFSAMIAVMCVGVPMQKIVPQATKRLSGGFGRLWVFFEIMLFVLVGASVNIKYAAVAGLPAVALIFAVLLFRMAGVCVCTAKSRLSPREQLFCMLAYLPKATVQAAIGGIPLALGLACGEAVLTVAVLSIIITAPLGAFLIDLTYKKLLSCKE